MPEVRRENAKFIKIKKPAFYNWYKDGELKLKAPVEKVIRKRLKGGLVPTDKPDTLKVDTIIPAELTLEIDGLGGMVPGDVIQTEYIQPQYNVNIDIQNIPYGPFVYFQVVGLNQKIDTAGWTTELITKMRINHIPYHQDMKPVKDKEEVDDTKKLVVIEKIIPPPKTKVTDTKDEKINPKPESILPSKTTLDKIDIDNYENVMPVGLGPKVHQAVIDILNKGTVNIGTKSQTFGLGSTGTLEEFIATENLRRNTSNQILLPKMSKRDSVSYGRNFIQKGSTYSNLQIGDQGFKLNKEAYEKAPLRPTIPVPIDTDEEPEDVVLDDLEFDEFKPWDVPPVTFRRDTTNEDRIIKVEKTQPKTKKIPKGRGPTKSTYRGHYWQNDKYLYSDEWYGQPSWRPIFKFADGSTHHFDIFPFDHPTRAGEKAVDTIRPHEDLSVRRNHWDDNIEAPTEKGISVLSRGGGDARAGFLGESSPIGYRP